MNPNDIKTLTDLHEELQADGLHLIDFLFALCESADREGLREAAERCAELGGEEDAAANIIKRIAERGL